MKLSSLDIRKQEFARVFRGYDVEEVNIFLQDLANQWQELTDDVRRSNERVKDQQLKLDHYMKVEEALEEALQTARVGARQTIENAEHKAKALLDDATRLAVDISREAELERVGVKKEAARYSIRQTEIVAKMRAFLLSELEILAQYDGEDPGGLIKLISAETGKRAELVQDISDHQNESDSYEEFEVAEDAADEEEEDVQPSFVFESDAADVGVKSDSDAEQEADCAPVEDSEMVTGNVPLENIEIATRGAPVVDAETEPVPLDDSEPVTETMRLDSEPEPEARPAWRVNPLVSQEPKMSTAPEPDSISDEEDSAVEKVRSEGNETAASEEIKKIRRILEDLEK